jgi:putative transposase
VLPKHWIVKRTYGWLRRYCRRSENYERNTASSESMIHSMILVMLRRLERAKV